jgi:short-subunit dehydrogenase
VSFSGKTVLVTGGSSGIGLELAKLFAKDGASLTLVASDAAKLERAATQLEKECGRRPAMLVKDLSDRRTPHEIFETLGAVDVLVNNAGFGLRGALVSADASKIAKLVDVNVRALAELTALFLPGMVSRGWGRVLNVASTAGFQAIPVEAAYSASKSFVILFSESIALETKGTGVSVTCLCPGATRTPFFNEHIPASKLLARVMMSPETVARAGFDALRRGKTLAIPGFRNQAGQFVERFLPRALVSKIARRVVE